MDNCEEVLRALEELSRKRQQQGQGQPFITISSELDEYLLYVARTGDSFFRWPLVKHLYKEKLLSVIAKFYSISPGLDIPLCPNVDPFDCETVKCCILEKIEQFHAAPFTLQRICELLTQPTRQYSRVDKFMRAFEKNILVVSTREPDSLRIAEQERDDNNDDTFINGDEDNDNTGWRNPFSRLYRPLQPLDDDLTRTRPLYSDNDSTERDDTKSADDDRAAFSPEPPESDDSSETPDSTPPDTEDRTRDDEDSLPENEKLKITLPEEKTETENLDSKETTAAEEDNDEPMPEEPAVPTPALEEDSSMECANVEPAIEKPIIGEDPEPSGDSSEDMEIQVDSSDSTELSVSDEREESISAQIEEKEEAISVTVEEKEEPKAIEEKKSPEPEPEVEKETAQAEEESIKETNSEPDKTEVEVPVEVEVENDENEPVVPEDTEKPKESVAPAEPEEVQSAETSVPTE